MPGKKRLRYSSQYTKALHARRMGDDVLPDIRTALRENPQLRYEVKQRVSKAAKRAEKKSRRLEHEIPTQD